MAEIRKDAKLDVESKPWAERILERRHHRVVYETGDNADYAHLQLAKRILRRLKELFEGLDFYLDDSPVSIYKLSIPDEQGEPQVENLYIKERNGALKLLTSDSAIVAKIPKKVRTVRIFADAEGPVLKQIREKARELESTA